MIPNHLPTRSAWTHKACAPLTTSANQLGISSPSIKAILPMNPYQPPPPYMYGAPPGFPGGPMPMGMPPRFPPGPFISMPPMPPMPSMVPPMVPTPQIIAKPAPVAPKPMVVEQTTVYVGKIPPTVEDEFIRKLLEVCFCDYLLVVLFAILLLFPYVSVLWCVWNTIYVALTT